ncbi:MAG: ATP-binding cassette domain-containing protein [Mycobacteriaceae bacterium]
MSTAAAEPRVRDDSRRIVADGLTKHFGATVAVSDLSFSAGPGTVTALVGPHGAGKTTTLRMILGLTTPTTGTATVEGVGFAQLDWPGRIVGAVLDVQGFPPRRSARKHLLVYCAATGVSDERADAVLDLVGLTADATRAVGGFAPGMRQRLALGLALLGEPQILVLDEPTIGLDPEGIQWLRGLLQEFARSGRTVLLTGRTLREVAQTADSLVIITGGRSVFRGNLAELRGSRTPRLLVACGDAAALAHALVPQQTNDVVWRPDGRLAVGGVSALLIRETARATHVAVYGIAEEQDDLEQHFRSLTELDGDLPSPWASS